MTFHSLHEQATPLQIANVWDASSAQIAQDVSYLAIGTSSAAIASLLGTLQSIRAQQFFQPVFDHVGF